MAKDHARRLGAGPLSSEGETAVSDESFAEGVRRSVTEKVLPSASAFASRLFGQLSPELLPRIGFVFVPTDATVGQPFTVGLPDADALVADLEPAIAAAIAQQGVAMVLGIGLPRTAAVRSCICERLEANTDAEIVWCAGPASHRLGFDAVALVGLPSGRLATVPNVETRGFGRTSLAHSLLWVLARALADHLTTSDGLWQAFRPREDGEDFLRDAGEHFMFAVGGHLHKSAFGGLGINAFGRLNRIASLPYEGADGAGAVVLAPADDESLQRTMTFTRKVPLADAVWARKMLELSTGALALAASDDEIHALVPRSTSISGRFWVEFRGRQTWQLSYDRTLLMRTRLSVPGLPLPQLGRVRFDEAVSRLFSESAVDTDALWSIVERARENAHGTTLVFSSAAAEEAARLSAHGMPVTVAPMGGDTTEAVTRIDGAVLLDLRGHCHGIGVILDGRALVPGVPSRGARFNSALRYVTSDWTPPSLVVVFSEDGPVDLFPRLRPSMPRAEFETLLDCVRAHPKGRPMPNSVREVCRQLARDYEEYLPSDLWDRVMDGVFSLDALVSGEDDPRPTMFEKHHSDFY